MRRRLIINCLMVLLPFSLLAQFQCGIEAAVTGEGGVIYFFNKADYIHYSKKANDIVEGHPIPTVRKWGRLTWTDFDAATHLYGNSKYYFFKGNQVLRYDMVNRKPDNGYPQSTTVFGEEIPDSPDAIINLDNETFYFFKNEKLHIFSRKERRVTQVVPLDEWFSGLPKGEKPDAGLRVNEKNYLCYGSQVYQLTERRVDNDFPQSLNTIFKGVTLGKCNDTPKFDLNAERPAVIALVHGITAEADSPNGRKQFIGKIQHPQFYWGYDFMRLLLGGSPNTQLYFDVAEQPVRTIPAAFSAKEWNNHNKKAYPFSGSEKYGIVVDDKRNDTPELMLTFRNGGATVEQQIAETIDQLYESYQYHYGNLPTEKQPMIYVVAHSFGGLVMRAIMSGPVLENEIQGFSSEQQQQAKFLRDRMVSLTTLSTPHEGSPLIDLSKDLSKQFLQLADMIESADISKDFEDLGILPNEKTFIEEIADGIRDFEQDMIEGSRNCIKSISKLKNPSDLLKPEYARRSDGSLIPVYTLTGSNPGHLFFLSPRPAFAKIDFSIKGIPVKSSDMNMNSMADLLEMDDIGYYKTWAESAKLVFLDVLGKGMVKPKQGIWDKKYAGFNYGDQFRTPNYGINVKLGSFTATDLSPLLTEMIYPGYEIRFESDDYFDSDGFVGFNSGHGLKLGTSHLEHYANHKYYRLDNVKRAGSWYRIYGDRYGLSHPWDYDNHRSICFNPGTAAFIHNYIYKKGGPYAVNGLWSNWKLLPTEKSLPSKQIDVKITTVKNMSAAGEIDNGLGDREKADFFTYIKIGNAPFKVGGNAIDNKDFIASGDFQKGKDYIWKVSSSSIANGTIVPVIIRIMDHDDSIEGRHDVCSSSKHIYQNDIVLFVDVQNGKIYGEIEGQVGLTHEIKSNRNNANKVLTKIKIEVR